MTLYPWMTCLVFLTVFKFSVKCTHHLEIDDICILNQNGTTGRCKLLNNCPYAKEQLQCRKIPPRLCGFKHIEPIVCCEKIDETTVPSIVETTTDYQIVSKSTEKCSEYANLVYKNQSSPILLPGIFWEIVNTCDYDDKMRTTVTDKEFPHMVSIGYKTSQGQFKFRCTGALISEQYILTTASCTNLTYYGLPKLVRLGTTISQDNYFEYPEIQSANVQEFIRHPMYNESSRINDIALLKLSEMPILNSFTRPACINKIKSQIKQVISVGYSSIATGTFKTVTRKNFLNIESRNPCLSSSNNYNNPFLTVDISSRDRNSEESVLDLGGPLVVLNDNPYCTYTIVGLLSSVKQCSHKKIGYVTDVSRYIDWIEENVWSR